MKPAVIAVKPVAEFNSIQFEKRLSALKDSQDSINATCHWCLENRSHHKKIVVTWLNVLKRVKVEQRLTLFYLANDVIQYSKRKNYEFVDSWSTALQKATTMVREEKVKNKIIRIFKIWEQRGVYGEEFVTDLCGLISVSPTPRKGDEPHEFQSSYLITKIRNCAKLEGDTDQKLKQYKIHNPKMMEGDVCATLKDRAHKDDVEKELEEYITHMEAYVDALKLEMKARNHLITILLQAESQLEHDKKDVKLVATAYKTFASRVKILKRKLDDLKEKLPSPMPSPDVNAPSPSPDSDLEYNDNDSNLHDKYAAPFTDISLFTTAGFYNPAQALAEATTPPISANNDNSGFSSNGFASFLGSNMPFNLQSMFNTGNTTTHNTDSSYSPRVTVHSQHVIAAPRVTPVGVPAPQTTNSNSNTSYEGGYGATPLAPPPLPPFGGMDSGGGSYGDGGYAGNAAYDPFADNNVYPTTTTSSDPYNPSHTSYDPTYPPPSALNSSATTTTSSYHQHNNNTEYSHHQHQHRHHQHVTEDRQMSGGGGGGTATSVEEEYNPEQEPDNEWENDVDELTAAVAADDAEAAAMLAAGDLSAGSGDEIVLLMQETPDSPPTYDREAYGDGRPVIEYHDGQPVTGAVDVDHRVLNMGTEKSVIDQDSLHKKTDVDHRNLISLTSSPRENSNSAQDWAKSNDQDYRVPPVHSQLHESNSDQDYRHTTPTNFHQKLSLNLPPPPPPPPTNGACPSTTTTTPATNTTTPTPRQAGARRTNNDSIDMDLSDDDEQLIDDIISGEQTTTRGSGGGVGSGNALQPPPPFPELELLDEDEQQSDYGGYNEDTSWQQQWNNTSGGVATPPPPPPPLPMMAPLLMRPLNNYDEPQLYSKQSSYNGGGGGKVRGFNKGGWGEGGAWGEGGGGGRGAGRFRGGGFRGRERGGYRDNGGGGGGGYRDNGGGFRDNGGGGYRDNGGGGRRGFRGRGYNGGY